MAFVEDLDCFMLDFAIPATINGIADIDAIYDSAYVLSDFTDTYLPSVLVKSSDIVGVVQGYAVLVADLSFVITSIQPDGTGMTRLILERQP